MSTTQPVDYTISNFGRIPYGSKTTSPLRMANPSDACSLLQFPKNSEYMMKQKNFINTSPILLVERGGCSFVEKVRNAQQYGAKVVIIQDLEDEPLLVMGDNGDGDEIYIPALFITNSNGNLLNEAIKIQQKEKIFKEIILEIDFNLESPSQGNESSLIFFINPLQIKTQKMLNGFFNKYFEFREDINFLPVYDIYTGLEDYDYYEQCLFKGKYCANIYDNENIGVGRKLLKEYLYQSCVFQSFGIFDWSQYVKLHSEICNDILDYESCRLKVSEMIKINSDYYLLKKCQDFDENGNNQILNKQLNLNKEYQIENYPQIAINNKLYNGSNKGLDILEAVCASNKYKSRECLKLIHRFRVEYEKYTNGKYRYFLSNNLSQLKNDEKEENKP